MKYEVNFNTGVGNYTSNLTLKELIKKVSEELTLTKKSITIISIKSKKEVAFLPWHNNSAENSPHATKIYENDGYYGEWKLLDKWGGIRNGSGRKPTGRTRRTYYLTDSEASIIKKTIQKIRSER